MIVAFISDLKWFIGLFLLQTVIFDRMLLAGIVTPLIYVYFVMRLDGGLPRWGILLWGFAMGLAMDMMHDTPGVNAAATVLLAFMCPVYRRLFASRDLQDNAAFTPSLRVMGVGNYFKFALAAVLTHHLAVVLLEYFSFDTPLTMLLRWLGCTALTLLLVMSVEWCRR